MNSIFSILTDANFWIVWGSLQLLVFLQALLARLDNFLTPTQMMYERGTAHGLPFLGHGGMYGDAIIVSFISASIFVRYQEVYLDHVTRGSKPALMALGISTAATLIMHWVWAKGSYTSPSVHIDDGKVIAAGWMHVAYMVPTLALIIAHYFYTPHRIIPTQEVYLFSGLLIVHILLGIVHVVPNVLKPVWWTGQWKDGLLAGVIFSALLVYKTWDIVHHR